MVRRLEGWPLKLSDFLHERREAPFAWGHHDCLLFAADAVLAITGTDLAAAHRGYATKEAAETLLARLGGMRHIVCAALGPGHGNLLKARRGDVVLMDLGPGPTAGILDDTGRRIAAVSDARGLIRLPLAAASWIWGY